MILAAGWSASDWASVLSAAFTAVAAFAAWASVARVEHDRWRRDLPNLHVEVIVDAVQEEVRMTVANLGGPAREVYAIGVLGEFGIIGTLAPSGYWRRGEQRVFRISMEPAPVDEAQVAIFGRDLRKRYVVAGTLGGATECIPLRKAKKSSPAKDWARLFPKTPDPTRAKYAPMNVEFLEPHRLGVATLLDRAARVD